MKRHGDNHLGRLAEQALIAKTFPQHAGQKMPEMNLPPVFEIMNEVAHYPAAAISGGGEVESQLTIPAIHAPETAGDRAAVGLAAYVATRTRQTGAGSTTSAAKSAVPWSQRATAGRAMRRVKKPGGCLKKCAGPPVERHVGGRD